MKNYRPRKNILKTSLKIFAILAIGAAVFLPSVASLFEQKNGDLIEFAGPTVLFLQNAEKSGDNSPFLRGISAFFCDDAKNQQNYGNLYEKKSVREDEIPAILNENCGKWDLICAEGEDFCAKIEKIARNFPKQNFAFFNAKSAENLPNASAFSFAQEESAFLCGILAAQKIKSDGAEEPKIALVLEKKGDAQKPQALGFLQGVLAQRCDAAFLFFLGGEDAVKAAFDSEAQVVFVESESLCAKSAEFLQNPRYEARKGRVIFADEGAAADANGGANFALLTRTLVRAEAMAKFALSQAKSGELKGGGEKLGLSRGAVDFFRNEAALKYDDFSFAASFADKIAAKKIAVYSDAKTLMSRTFVPPEIAALFDENQADSAQADKSAN